ncbi:MAG: hypothetical protein M3P95_07450, partial [Actinomycetota bacterium]|nr:hypothetical protein [Actinomycetota bacterium]
MRSVVVSVIVRQARACVADAVLLAEDAVLAVVPSGGQGRSRRNAWRAMAAEAALAAARRESEAA